MLKKLVTISWYVIFAFFFILISDQRCIGQKKAPDYVFVDSVFSQGELSFSNDTVTFQKRSYTAADLNEFQEEGQVYVSMSHEGIPKFYKKIVGGKTSLYGREKLFYINRGDTTILLARNDFRDVLISVLRCEEGGDFLPFVQNNRASLANAVKRYNKQGCQSGYFPYIKRGVTAGYSRLSLKGYFDDALNDFKESSNGLFVGVFEDFPLFVKYNLFATVEAYYLYSKFSIYSENPQALNFTEGNVNAVTIPFGLKWLDISKSVKKYVEVGSLLSLVNLKTDGIYKASISDHKMEPSFEEMKKPTSLGIGFNGAVGLEIPWEGMRNINLELRYNKSFSLSDGPLKQFSSLSIVAAINL